MDYDFRERLYTINQKGERLWVYPTILRGKFRKVRSWTAFFLITIYITTPWTKINGQQTVLLDLIAREFTFFGTKFFASDTEFLVLILGGLGLALFFFTAILGRIWCGWACPETVFLEFIFRPIERLIEGDSQQRRKLDSSPWSIKKAGLKAIKWLMFSITAWILATTALAYFMGSNQMLTIITGSPFNHPSLFIVSLIGMGAVLFQFGWFREQFCTILCPYARFQSVLMDNQSLIVGYDKMRGEPRGKLGKTSGDCVDCGQCVRVCPTGIDIRNGLQLECVQCTACIDACDDIMLKVQKPAGLIRYTTEQILAGGRHSIFRFRVLTYALLLTIYFGAFIYMISNKEAAEIIVLRKKPGQQLYTHLTDGRISNHINLHITNKLNISDSYKVTVNQPSVTLLSKIPDITINPGELGHLPIFVAFPRTSQATTVEILVTSLNGYRKTIIVPLIKPD